MFDFSIVSDPLLGSLKMHKAIDYAYILRWCIGVSTLDKLTEIPNMNYTHDPMIH
jgi:hypothetical protein